MKILELFSGTHSVGKVAKQKGWDVVSLDLDNADINIDILKWDYKKDYKEGDFDIVWGSPPCHTFSHCRRSWIGRKIKAFGDEIVTPEMLDEDMEKNGVPLLNKTLEIIEYFKPKFWFIENPQTSKMKNYLTHLDHYDVDYCKYSDWGYRKRTRIWTNKKGFEPKLCKKDCENMFDPNKHKTEMINAKKPSIHKNNLGNSKRNKRSGGSVGSLDTRYRIPPKLIESLFEDIDDKYKNKDGSNKKMHKNNLGGVTNKLTGGRSGNKELKYRIPPKLIESLFEDI